MLAVSSYPKEYVERVRAKLERELAAWERLAARDGVGSAAEMRELEPMFFNNMLLALESSFVHRVRNREGKDGNPLNEVRVIAHSLVSNGGVMGADKTIKLAPDRSVLGYDVGDEIALGAEDFRKLSDAFLGEIEEKYA